MTRTPNLDAVTIILPCYNESHSIEEAIKRYRDFGFHNILVMDDGSLDDTLKIAQKSKVQIISSTRPRGFNIAVIRSLFEVKTKYTLIVNPYDSVAQDSLMEFLDFGIRGEHEILISQSYPSMAIGLPLFRGIAIPMYLREHYGISMPDLSFDAVFVGHRILGNARKLLSNTGTYVYFDLVSSALKSDFKIGAYPLEFTDETRGSKLLVRAFIHYLHFAGSFRNYAFPRLAFSKFSRELSIAIIAAIVGSTLTVWLTIYLTS